MCVNVIVRLHDAEAFADTKGELRMALGVEPVSTVDEYDEWTDDECLCPCDIEATAKAAGMSARYDCPDWIMEPLQANDAEARNL